MPVSIAYTEKPEAEAETTTFCGLVTNTAFAYYTFDAFTAPTATKPIYGIAENALNQAHAIQARLSARVE
jgi:hypothetical protein